MQLAGQAPHIVVRGLDSGSAGSSVSERLESLYEAVSEASFVCVGDIIPTDGQEGFLRCVGCLAFLVFRSPKLHDLAVFGSTYTVLAQVVGCRWRMNSSF